MSKNTETLEERIRRKVVDASGTPEMVNLHTKLLSSASAGDPIAKNYVMKKIRESLRSEKLGLKETELESMAEEIYSENWGLSILDKYNKSNVDELSIRGRKISYQIRGVTQDAPELLPSNKVAETICRRALEFAGGEDINEINATVSTEGADNTRITVAIPPVAREPYLNIRKADSFMPVTSEMLKTKTLTPTLVRILEILTKGRANIIVIGEMGSGKTAFMKWIFGMTPEELTIGIMESSFELNLHKLYPHKRFIQLQEHGDTTLQDLFSLQLRQNVDIMCVGESRSYEVNELIKGMSRGHSGSIGTAHSLTALSVIDDFADMILESGKNVSIQSLRERIARAIDIVIKFRKLPLIQLPDGTWTRKRVCASLSEITIDKMGHIEENKLVEFIMDEEDKEDFGHHVYLNSISDELKLKLHSYGASEQEIEGAFDYTHALEFDKTEYNKLLLKYKTPEFKKDNKIDSNYKNDIQFLKNTQKALIESARLSLEREA